MVPGLGNVLGRRLLGAFGSPAAMLGASRARLEGAGLRPELARAVESFSGWADAERQAERLRAAGGSLLTWVDPSYPELLRQLHDAPLCLFVLGEVTAADDVCVALVGSRRPSAYGLSMAESLGEGLAACGVTVVSGLARGIDGAAHAAALRAGGRTIAVLGSGIDVIYPSEHHRLLMQIAENGAVLSEFLMGTPPEADNFPMRNRIISGLSRATVVVEAAERSGSLITARCAVEQNREVFAVPGPVGPLSRGPHGLLRQGAMLAETAGDIVREIAPQLGTARSAGPSPRLEGPAASIFGCLGEQPLAVDEIVERSGLDAANVLNALLELEISGLVRQLPGSRFVRGPLAAAAR